MTQFQSSVLFKFVTVSFVMVAALIALPSAASAQSSRTGLRKIFYSPGSNFQKMMTEDHPMEAAVCDCSLNSTSSYAQPSEADVGLLSLTGKYLSDTYHSVADWSVTKAKTAVAAVGQAIRPGCKLVGSGKASYYGQGDGFAGKKTASGKRLVPTASVVAHKTLPFGTKVIIKDRSTGKTAEATVEDRGPYAHGRVIDLTPAVFKKLASLSRGVLSSVEVYACN